MTNNCSSSRLVRWKISFWLFVNWFPSDPSIVGFFLNAIRLDSIVLKLVSNFTPFTFSNLEGNAWTIFDSVRTFQTNFRFKSDHALSWIGPFFRIELHYSGLQNLYELRRVHLQRNPIQASKWYRLFFYLIHFELTTTRCSFV